MSAPVSVPKLPQGAVVRTVSQITAMIKGTLEQAYPVVWVEGEITGVSRPASGHLYFKLKDASALLDAVIYRTNVLRLPAGIQPRDGLAVVACGRITVYEQRGDYQFSIERMFPKGMGAAELALRQLKERLHRQGWFDQKRKRKLPSFPRTVCVIASASGAAVHDLIKILGERWPATRVLVRSSRVQGTGAAEEIAAAIAQVNRWRSNGHIDAEVIILGRGGGSIEDLAAFNQEVVAHAIFHSKIPIVSAVGHEVDTTIADLVADHRASTPSHAAEMIVPHREELLTAVLSLADRLKLGMTRRCRTLRQRLDDMARRRVLQQPLDRVHDAGRRLDDWEERLKRAIHQRLVEATQAAEAAAGRLESLSPLNVLARGYSLTRLENNPKLLRSADDLTIGDRLVTQLASGRVTSRVEAVEASELKKE